MALQKDLQNPSVQNLLSLQKFDARSPFHSPETSSCISYQTWSMQLPDAVCPKSLPYWFGPALEGTIHVLNSRDKSTRLEQSGLELVGLSREQLTIAADILCDVSISQPAAPQPALTGKQCPVLIWAPRPTQNRAIWIIKPSFEILTSPVVIILTPATPSNGYRNPVLLGRGTQTQTGKADPQNLCFTGKTICTSLKHYNSFILLSYV